MLPCKPLLCKLLSFGFYALWPMLETCIGLTNIPTTDGLMHDMDYVKIDMPTSIISNLADSNGVLFYFSPEELDSV
ncbi:hypothetical protein Ahy_A08g039181 isoform B [Arachis hypogaea]|uniref:Uncharacterized protein n=1 Tax=Arachis hypogaea TaxID=3818 RepID=A0A445BVZ9_ARAHY|nr:hypothetical protein Ahy_A08g039181 isoform B [Arachis hypogaea]